MTTIRWVIAIPMGIEKAQTCHVSARPTTASNPLWGSPRLRAAPNGFGIQLVIIS